ncbi:MAG: hypothetical protein K6C11_01330 [Bacilli bacterium]|nr:hypothetical protein [Bacilli bacterium]
MKIIDDNKVFITKDAINRIRIEAGITDDSPIVSLDMYTKIIEKDLLEGGFFYDSSHGDELVEVTNEEAKEFVKNANWILDYSKYLGASLEEIESEFNRIASIFNPMVHKMEMLLNNIEDSDKRDAEYDKMREEMAPLNFILNELQECYFKRQKEIETANTIEETKPTNGKVAFIGAKTKKMTLREQLNNIFNRNK